MPHLLFLPLLNVHCGNGGLTILAIGFSESVLAGRAGYGLIVHVGATCHLGNNDMRLQMIKETCTVCHGYVHTQSSGGRLFKLHEKSGLVYDMTTGTIGIECAFWWVCSCTTTYGRVRAAVHFRPDLDGRTEPSGMSQPHVH